MLVETLVAGLRRDGLRVETETRFTVSPGPFFMVTSPQADSAPLPLKTGSASPPVSPPGIVNMFLGNETKP